ncbi:MAG: GAF domain-containing protein [Bacteroidia bacterium]|nr:GAF domain-containing protein [Bacteroidia bacterium]
MAEELILTPGITREERYREILPQVEAVITGETDFIANLANVSAILKEAHNFFWVGFYRMMEGELVLGPFQGPLACTRIALSRGVCGASATQQKTLIVPDVEKFPGHIACSSASQSEIVVPLVVNGQTVLVLDVDSDVYDDFSETDQTYLEQIMEIIRKVHYSAAPPLKS